MLLGWKKRGRKAGGGRKNRCFDNFVHHNLARVCKFFGSEASFSFSIKNVCIVQHLVIALIKDSIHLNQLFHFLYLFLLMNLHQIYFLIHSLLIYKFSRFHLSPRREQLLNKTIKEILSFEVMASRGKRNKKKTAATRATPHTGARARVIRSCHA